MNDLEQLALQQAPMIIAALKAVFSRQYPTSSPPTSADVIAAYQAAFESTLAKDALWLSQHGSR